MRETNKQKNWLVIKSTFKKTTTQFFVSVKVWEADLKELLFGGLKQVNTIKIQGIVQIKYSAYYSRAFPIQQSDIKAHRRLQKLLNVSQPVWTITQWAAPHSNVKLEQQLWCSFFVSVIERF